MRLLRFSLPTVLAIALIAPLPANARLAGETAALTQSAVPALACVAEAPTTGCTTDARFEAGDGTIDVASFGSDTYVLRGFPNTAFQANGLYRLRREASGYVVAQCFSLDATPGCIQTPLISNATKIAVSAKRLYLATSFPSNAGNSTVGGITVIPRDPATGVLSTPTSCRSSVAVTAQDCVTGDPLGAAATGLAVTPDGSGLYVTTSGPNGAAPSTVLAYDLATDGDLDTAPTCLASVATTGCTTNATAAQDAALSTAGDVDVSADGKNVYLTTKRGITALTRTSVAGAQLNDVAFASCLSNLPDADAACGAFPADLRFVLGISHAGASRYVSGTAEVSVDSPGSVLLLNRNVTTGALTLDSCRSTAATAGCTPATDLSQPAGVAISPDGTRVHVAGQARFTRGRVLTLAVSGSALNTLPGTTGCIQADDATATCASGARGIDNAFTSTIDITADGKDVVVGTLNGVAFLTRSSAVPPPPVVKGVAQPRPTSTVRPDRKRIVKVKVTCTGKTTCVGKLTLASTGKVKAKPGAKARKLTFATASYSVPAGKAVVIKLRLSKSAAASLKRLRKVKSTVTARSTAGVVRTAKTTLLRQR